MQIGSDPLQDYMDQALFRTTDSAGAVVFQSRNGDREVLMVRIKGGWSFPKGHIEFGETEEQAACREVLEETGISIDLLPGFRSVTGSGRAEENRKIFYFLGKAAGGTLRPEPGEVLDAAWQPEEKVAELLRYPEDLPVWEAARNDAFRLFGESK